MPRQVVAGSDLAGRRAARQSYERPWVQPQTSSSCIRNRPALPSSPSPSVRAGKAQGEFCTCKFLSPCQNYLRSYQPQTHCGSTLAISPSMAPLHLPCFDFVVFSTAAFSRCLLHSLLPSLAAAISYCLFSHPLFVASAIASYLLVFTVPPASIKKPIVATATKLQPSSSRCLRPVSTAVRKSLTPVCPRHSSITSVSFLFWFLAQRLADLALENRGDDPGFGPYSNTGRSLPAQERSTQGGDCVKKGE